MGQQVVERHPVGLRRSFRRPLADHDQMSDRVDAPDQLANHRFALGVAHHHRRAGLLNAVPQQLGSAVRIERNLHEACLRQAEPHLEGLHAGGHDLADPVAGRQTQVRKPAAIRPAVASRSATEVACPSISMVACGCAAGGVGEPAADRQLLLFECCG